MAVNYQLALDKILQALDGRTPRLLLHSCCAPCSSYVLEYLSQYFLITVDYYNPNIAPPHEYERRALEQANLIARTPYSHPVQYRESTYDPQVFYAAVKGLEDIPEGGARCFACYRLRLAHAAQAARNGGYDYFTTTLSISPHKNAAKLNEIGFALQEEYNVAYLPADFKKRGGFHRSTQLAAQYGLYRQDYCGCVFSKRAREAAPCAQKRNP